MAFAHPTGLVETLGFIPFSPTYTRFKKKGLNELADAGNFRKITKLIQGQEDGPDTHLDWRIQYYQRARRVLGLPAWADSGAGAAHPAGDTMHAQGGDTTIDREKPNASTPGAANQPAANPASTPDVSESGTR